MGKRATTTLLITIGAAVVLAIGSSIASALPSASTPASAQAGTAKVFTIAMRDPGCHWFLVNGQYKAKLAVSGATQFVNQDEAAVVFKAKGFARRVPVGKTITVSKAGVYHITMVGQAPDDNHLVLAVK